MVVSATLISSSTIKSLSLFRDFIIVSLENPTSHKYEVENCNRSRIAFNDILEYSFSTWIQNLSRVVSLKRSLRLPSFLISVRSSSSWQDKLVDSKSSNETNGFRTHFYSSKLIEGKYSCIFDWRSCKCAPIAGINLSPSSLQKKETFWISQRQN